VSHGNISFSLCKGSGLRSESQGFIERIGTRCVSAVGPIETHECVSDGGVPHHDEATDHGIKDAHPTSSTAAAGEPVGALTLRVAELDLLRDLAMGEVREGRPQRNVAAGFNAQWNLQRMHGGFLGERPDHAVQSRWALQRDRA
jgi:hypothetical protein